MRSVLIAAHDEDVSTLRNTLVEEGLEPTSSQSLGAGIALADALTNDIDAAVAVLPASAAGLSAVLVEVGVVLGRGLPLLVVTSPGSELPPALVGVRTVVSDLDNHDALRFQVRMFAQSLGANRLGRRGRSPAGKPLSSEAVAVFRKRLFDIPQNVPQIRGAAFEDWIVDVLRAGGATVEQDRRYTVDEGIDAVASIPGEEHRLGPLLVEAKVFHGAPRLQHTARQLVGQVLARGAGLGLIIYESAEPVPEPEVTPRVISLWAKDLISQLERMSLGEVLLRARNEAIHRL